MLEFEIFLSKQAGGDHPSDFMWPLISMINSKNPDTCFGRLIYSIKRLAAKTQGTAVFGSRSLYPYNRYVRNNNRYSTLSARSNSSTGIIVGNVRALDRDMRTDLFYCRWDPPFISSVSPLTPDGTTSSSCDKVQT